MLTSRHTRLGAALTAILFAVGCTGADGSKGAPGDQGTLGDAGPSGTDGTDGVVTGGVSGSVTDGEDPLAGVAVSVEPGTAAATTDAQGGFSLKALPIGSYLLTFTRGGYLDQTVVVAVQPSGTTTVKVSLAVDPASVPPPTVSAAGVLKAGFAKPVSLKATATGKAPLTYQWTQLQGPSVTLAGEETDTLSFTTQDLVSAIGPTRVANARFGTMGMNPDQAGNYVFEVAVTDGGGVTARVEAKVNATRPTAGLRMVPIGIPVWLQGDGPLVAAAQTTWSWTLDSTAAAGSTAAIEDASAQFPSFTPDVKGIYKVTESISKKTLTVYAGTWLGAMTPTGDAPAALCGVCHTGNIATDNFTPWKKTRHFKGLADKLDGVTTADGAPFVEECLSCHTLGYDRSAANGGFDDVAGSSSWKFPDTLEAGNWATLVADPKLGQLAGIQCENCHGPHSAPAGGPHTSSITGTPDTAARISWSSDVCASCHQEKPYYYNPGQWQGSKHADLELAYADGTVEARGTTAAHCGRCHTAQGYAQYVAQLKLGYTGTLTSDGKPATGSPQTNAATIASLTKLGLTQATVQPQTCQSCHDPHDATNPAQLRIYDAVGGLPNGMGKVSGLGSGVVCVTCHNTRNAEHSDFVAAPTSFTAPHAAAQTDVVFGFNAYFMPRYTPSAHLAVKDSCAGCHYGIATGAEQAAKEVKNHSFTVDNTICAACHSSNVDGAGLQAANQLSLDGLGKAITGKVLNLINKALLPAGGSQYTLRVWDPATDFYSSTAASNVALSAPPTSIDLFEIHGSAGFILHMSAPLAVALVDAQGNPGGSITTPDLYVAAGNLRSAAGTTPLFAAGSDYTKALWNYFLLHGDGTKGVHNPSFFSALIGATSARVAALP